MILFGKRFMQLWRAAFLFPDCFNPNHSLHQLLELSVEEFDASNGISYYPTQLVPYINYVRDPLKRRQP